MGACIPLEDYCRMCLKAKKIYDGVMELFKDGEW